MAWPGGRMTLITDWGFYAVAVPAVLLLGISKSGFGAGFGSLAVPLMALSVSVPQIPAIKAAVREVDLLDCKAIAEQVQGLESAEEVREALRLYHEATVDTSPVLEN